MRRIETTAGWLAARGSGPGDVVAILMKNSSAFIELTFADFVAEVVGEIGVSRRGSFEFRYSSLLPLAPAGAAALTHLN
jgi:hypothetical protein